MRKHIANQRPTQRFGPFSDLFALSGAHTPGEDHAALLPPVEPVALLRAFQMRLRAQPRLVALPPVAQGLLPFNAGIVQFAVKRFSERAVDVQRAVAQCAHSMIKR
ncbi:hypothetical protein D3C78_1134740 [compost metagenome]